MPQNERADNFNAPLKQQWLTASIATTMAEVEAARMMYWCKDLEEEAPPNLVLLISLWAQAYDLSERLDETPRGTNIEFGEATAESGVLTLDEIKDKVAEIDGFMLASEQYRSKEYQELLQDQLSDALTKLTDGVSELEEGHPDEDDLGLLLEKRDQLEYARMGINVLRMEKRLLQVNYDNVADTLAQIDGLGARSTGLVAIVNKSPQLTVPYSPSTFWWRHKTKR